MTNQARKTVLITGASSGLGLALARRLAAEGWRVGMVARSAERGASALESIRRDHGDAELRLFVADLASQASIHGLADEVKGAFETLSWLINNAGTAFPERRLSPDGIECALAVNHLAPFLLTRLLLERLIASAPASILNIGTRMDTALDFEDLDWGRRRYRMMQAYGQSKLGMLHFTFELARRLEGQDIRVNCIFPGVFNSNLGGTDGAQGPFWKLVKVLLGRLIPSPDTAAQAVLETHAAAERSGLTGQYLGRRGSLRAPAQALDSIANRRLWEISERLTGLAGDGTGPASA